MIFQLVSEAARHFHLATDTAPVGSLRYARGPAQATDTCAATCRERRHHGPRRPRTSRGLHIIFEIPTAGTLVNTGATARPSCHREPIRRGLLPDGAQKTARAGI